MSGWPNCRFRLSPGTSCNWRATSVGVRARSPESSLRGEGLPRGYSRSPTRPLPHGPCDRRRCRRRQHRSCPEPPWKRRCLARSAIGRIDSCPSIGPANGSRGRRSPLERRKRSAIPTGLCRAWFFCSAMRQNIPKPAKLACRRGWTISSGRSSSPIPALASIANARKLLLRVSGKSRTMIPGLRGHGYCWARASRSRAISPRAALHRQVAIQRRRRTVSSPGRGAGLRFAA